MLTMHVSQIFFYIIDFDYLLKMSLFWPNTAISSDLLAKSKNKKQFHNINTSFCSQVVHNNGIFLWHYFKKGSVHFFLTHIFWTLRSQRSLICGICLYDKTHILNLAKRRCAFRILGHFVYNQLIPNVVFNQVVNSYPNSSPNSSPSSYPNSYPNSSSI